MVKQQATGFITAAATAIVLFALAFVAAPKSCDGGLEFYLLAGLVAFVSLFSLPFATRRRDSLALRLAWSFGFLFFGIAAWIASAHAANVRILCRLF